MRAFARLRTRIPLACALFAWAGSAAADAPAPSPALPVPAAAEAESEPAAEAVTPLGLWVLAEGSERVLERPERIPALVDDALAIGATDLFVQVYRRGVAWWPSEVAEPAEAWQAARSAAGAESPDPLAALLAAAHAAGLRVHAWMNVLSLSDNADAAVVRALGPGVLQVDRRGRSILSYPEMEMPEPEAPHLRMGTPAIWLDPAAPGVSAWYRGLVAELFERYPKLDGLHLDYIRYPDVLPFAPGSRFGVGMDFGYGEATRARFELATGLEAPFGDALANANDWDHWRRAELAGLVGGLRTALEASAPAAKLSAAVFAWTDRAYLSVYQDWLGWLDAGHLDFAVPMLYTRDERLLRYQAGAFVGGIAGDRVWIGLGAWLFRRTPELAAAQLRTVDAFGAKGRVLFSWDALAASPALRDAFRPDAGPDAGPDVAGDAP